MTTSSPPQHVETAPLQVEGHGLITGLPVSVSIQRLPAGRGIVFDLGDGVTIPARLEAIANADRGVTLGHPSGKFIAIVEHFLCAASLCGLSDLHVQVSGAPELPILDGSAGEWVSHLQNHFHGLDVSSGGLASKDSLSTIPPYELPQGVFYTHNETIRLYAVPHTHFKLTYTVDFNHPGLQNAWSCWDSKLDHIDDLAPARTFGFVAELPKLQAAGLAKGVSLENTLGLTEDGGYTTPLRFDHEPIHHKMLDLIGDFTLMGLNPLGIKAHVYAFNAGHSSHTAFAQKLKPRLLPASTS